MLARVRGRKRERERIRGKEGRREEHDGRVARRSLSRVAEKESGVHLPAESF